MGTKKHLGFWTPPWGASIDRGAAKKITRVKRGEKREGGEKGERYRSGSKVVLRGGIADSRGGGEGGEEHINLLGGKRQGKWSE